MFAHSAWPADRPGQCLQQQATRNAAAVEQAELTHVVGRECAHSGASVRAFIGLTGFGFVLGNLGKGLRKRGFTWIGYY